MEDFIFGTLATDALKLIHYRASHIGVQHAYQVSPQDPSPEQQVTLSVDIGPNVNVDSVACYYTIDGRRPEGFRGKARVGQVAYFHRHKVIWNTLTWGYQSKWKTKLPAQAEGTVVRYLISAWSSAGGEEIFADWPDVNLTVNHAAKHFFENKPLPELSLMGNRKTPQIFNYHVDKHTPPDWAREAIIYHIFVDRFHPGKERDWEQTKNLKDPFGGTLWGVIEKLDYLAELGITAIWLSPIFPSPTVHRYNATDYFHVADTLGGDGALHELVELAHQRGIRIILDLVCNHISNQHPYFKDALKNSKSQYRDWFYFDEQEKHGYRTFFGVKFMPQVNLTTPAAREWMFEIAKYWLIKFDVDGYRLDYAAGPGPGFWSDFWEVCKGAKAESFCVGEVVEPPNHQYQYIGRMDGLLDFHLCEALRRTLGSREWSMDLLEIFLSRHLPYFPGNILLPSFLDNHDMDRFQFIAKGGEQALREAAKLQYELPGPPIIYYGTEVGLSQKVSKTSAVGLEASRGEMIWGDQQNKDLLEFYRGLIAKRKKKQPWKKRQI